MLEAQAPAKQTATDTINTLAGRLTNATLLEDRRAAILGLRSFAKEYPASVASVALRGLIACLTNDLEDVDTTKVVLETLLMLFNPNEKSPEASEDIALWLADEFTTRQDNIKVLLAMLESADFYSRLYSLQLLTAIFAARPERTQESILNAALGASRLSATLDDSREAIRNAGLVLLTALTQSSLELQKLVAFESAFDRIFHLIHIEGGLAQGGIVVQDCLELLSNLVRYNPSNQSLFRESGCVSKLAEILRSTNAEPSDEKDGEVWSSSQRDKNIWGILAVIRFFLVDGSVSTQANQTAFNKHGLLQQVLNLAFSRSTELPVKAEALYTCADMIRGNPPLQQSFAQFQVASVVDHEPYDGKNGTTNGTTIAYIVDALLELILSPPTGTSLDVRLAACECIKAYLFKHALICRFFVKRAIDGYFSGEDESPNVLTTLLEDEVSLQKSVDPYRVWFASVIVCHLIWNDSNGEASEDDSVRAHLMKVVEGDSSTGEEEITCIQIIAGNLVAGLQRPGDEHAVMGFFMLLCGWLYEDKAAVDDFLGEGSNIQVIMQVAASTNNDRTVLKGLSAVLLGIVYEFSTKDSKISRRQLQPILTTGLGRDRYLQALSQLRQHPLIRDFEAYAQGSGNLVSGQELPPYTYFDRTFVEFLKDNFSRLSRAIDRDPGIEQVTGDRGGIDRDQLDFYKDELRSLKAQLEEKEQLLRKAAEDSVNLQQKLDSEQANHRKTQDTRDADLQRLNQVNEAVRMHHNNEIEELRGQHGQEIARLQKEHESALHQQQASFVQQAQGFQAEIEKAAEQTERSKEYYERRLAQADRIKRDIETKLNDANNTISSLRKELNQSQQELVQLKAELSAVKKQLDGSSATSERDKEVIRKLKAKNEELEETVEDERTKVTLLEKEVSESEKAVKEKEEARTAAQTELDDLLLVLGELEDKRSRDKAKLKELGAEVSDNDQSDVEDDSVD